ncbi:MAG: DUF6228 family protein [Thermodesulfovibrionales bacterium]|jgi:hypothetical protein
MTTEFIIKTPSGPVLKFGKKSNYEDIEGWGSYIVSLLNAPVTGTVEINDLAPNRYAEYFEDLARVWKGWKGEKNIGSIEEDFTLTATSDSLGHISLRIELRADRGGSDWIVAGTVVLEAGSLDQIAKSAKMFFDYKSMP